ncbi:hypothetical protein CC80DRAFT_174550 [Byssothecium circinans]|uniref:Uncharacterized protein n=1 Tax=Byssothecium circinans TaxID=147558 RepID=A0A6A5TIL8_9PLEO|nr:hypothetical protein CC80DRAFT_174550 [Byssothecium circinans]
MLLLSLSTPNTATAEKVPPLNSMLPRLPFLPSIPPFLSKDLSSWDTWRNPSFLNLHILYLRTTKTRFPIDRWDPSLPKLKEHHNMFGAALLHLSYRYSQENKNILQSLHVSLPPSPPHKGHFYQWSMFPRRSLPASLPFRPNNKIPSRENMRPFLP